MQSARPRVEAIPAIASALAVIVAGLVLAGWTWNIDALKRIVPGFVSMNPLTAVAILLAGFSLAMQRTRETTLAHPAWTRVARLAAAAIVAIGLLRLASAGLGWETGGDQWLFANDLGRDNPVFPSRMAPNTAVNLVLLGLAMLTLDVTWRNGRRPTEWLASAALVIALLALAGYVYRVPEFSGVARFIPMALHTAVVFVALAIGIFVARPQVGMMAVVTGASPGGAMARRLFPGMVIALLALGLLRLEGERHGLYGAGLGVALYTVTNIIVFGLLIGWSAKSLHLADAERLRLSAQQRESDAQVRLLLDSTAEAIYGIDAEGRCTFINRACVRMLGYAGSDDLLGRDMHALLHHSHPDATPYPICECPIYQAIRSDVPAHVDDEMFWRADGSAFAVEYWAYPMRREDKLVGAVVTFLDITERRKSEERLRQSEERTRAIIDSASDAFIAIDADGIVIGWNQQATTMFGWSRDEAIGLRLSEMILPRQHRAAHEQGLRRYASTGVGRILNRRIELSALRRNGEEFPVEFAIWPVHAEGSPTFHGFIHDITERKQSEDSILMLNAELRANAIELQQTNRELEAFSYTISHDLRAPLRHIDGYARMLQEDGADQLDPDMRRYLDSISGSARQMGALIDDLLAFSRLGRKPVERTEVDMLALVLRVVHEVDGGERIEVGPLPPVHGDPVLLKQVWVNLVSNAVKYSAPRAETARIEISGDAAEGVARYRIRDNGVGFDMRYADKLFGVFQRLHSQEEFEGTGVGLAIAQRIVVRHGGVINAESEPGQGATFTFELPIAAHAAPAGNPDPTLFATETPA